MKVLVTYNSKTGFTKKYAEWIGEALACEVRPVKEVHSVEEYDVVVHGGWLMAGMVSGLAQIKKLSPKQLVVFGVGFTEQEDYVKTVKAANQLADTPVFYFLGGINPEKMNFLMSFVVKTVTKKPLVEMDLTDQAAIQPLLQEVESYAAHDC